MRKIGAINVPQRGEARGGRSLTILLVTFGNPFLDLDNAMLLGCFLAYPWLIPPFCSVNGMKDNGS